jgi:hypothetical protein
MGKNLNASNLKIRRREFLYAGASLIGLSIDGSRLASMATPAPSANSIASEFDANAFAVLPVEEPYGFVRQLREGLDPELGKRNPAAQPELDEMSIPSHGWRLLLQSGVGAPLRNAAQELQSYLKTAMQTEVSIEEHGSLANESGVAGAIVAGTRDQLPGCGGMLKQSKDYQIIVTPQRVIVCGYDELGSMYGLYNLEERFSLREAPFLPANLNTVRLSLYKARMTLSGIGWMEWPDKYLAMLPRYGFDSIYAAPYANPNGATAPGVYSHMKRANPAAIHDLIRRAGQYGIKLYCPILYNYTGTPDCVAGLRKLVRGIVTEFPEIRGYVLLTEGFYADKPTWDSHNIRQWIVKWAQAVSIVTEECHKINPDLEVLPWDYGIDFRPDQIELKKFVINQLPKDSIPLVTFENGKSFMFDGQMGYLKDYAISQIGPSEVAAAQLLEAKKQGMRAVYAKADTWASWQFGTFPYLPFPQQWYARYKALEKWGVDGVMESWTYGFKPNFVAEIRAWYSWSDAPPLDTLLRAIARRGVGAGAEDLAVNAWSHFSAAIRLDPDTGPTVGGNNAVANPFFFDQPHAKTFTLEHSFWDPKIWSENSFINPYWPYVFRGFIDGYVLYPDFTNQVNVAEEYAKPLSLPVFRKYLLLAADEMERGLEGYRKAALAAPTSKRHHAFRMVLLAEQIERMLRSNAAMLDFENLRFHLVKADGTASRRQILNLMVAILKEEIPRTQAALATAECDSRLGYEWEEDYLYSPYTIRKKLEALRTTLEVEIPAYRNRYGIPV